MTAVIDAAERAAHLDRTTRAQAKASDPSQSVWVSANAGTGKTHVLTMRVLRLLLSGTAPEKILCLTYTKAAAAEMSSRVFDELAKWVMVPEKELTGALSHLLRREPTLEERERARSLFASSIETPGGLKAQTIHAFCERLLQRFPLEAGIPPGFVVLDDEGVRALQKEATYEVLSRGGRQPDSTIGRALLVAIKYATEDRFHEVLADALKRRELLQCIDDLRASSDFGADAPFDVGLEGLLREALEVRSTVSYEDIESEIANVLDDGVVQRLVDALSTGTKTDSQNAEKLRDALKSEKRAVRVSAFSDFFLTKEGGPRARLMTKQIQEEHPDLSFLATGAQETVHRLSEERKALEVVEATTSLMVLADAVMQAYTELKSRRSALDFDDLISKTANLLQTAHSTDWVLYKLDGGIDHILVDESQDTSPEQWRIIDSLAREFFSGAGAREDARTLFAVGDEKQSIYSFQGAAPEMFAAKGQHYQDLAHHAGTAWLQVPLDLSFRSVSPILDAVDRVFGQGTSAATLGSDSVVPKHFSARSGQAGLVEIWPTEMPIEQETLDPWSPHEGDEVAAPALRLANRIAKTIEQWLIGEERIVSENRKIEPRDILILVRKRRPFAAAMVAALKARGIRVAGADRMVLVEQIAVKDLMALGDFLTLPEDDLSLACVLKSPMFGFDDDDLYKIAYGRKGTLWKALLDNRDQNKKFGFAVKTLIGWRARADFLPPFEFYSEILDKGGMRSRLLARLGADAAEAIDEFLNLALDYDLGAPPSLAGFLAWLRASAREIKRDMEQDANDVRVMTVHGAKGLEAPIVILADTCAAPVARNNSQKLVELRDVPRPSRVPAPVAWLTKGAKGIEGVGKACAARDAREMEEHRRLLYVAMTRARDRLYVTGFEGKQGRPRDCWYELILQGLDDVLEEVRGQDGAIVQRFSSEQVGETERPKWPDIPESDQLPLPDWVHTPAPREPRLTMPVAPSQLAPYHVDEEGEPAVRDVQDKTPLSPEETSRDDASVSPDDRRFLRGTITHALLEHLPKIEKNSWPTAAQRYADNRGSVFSADVRDSIVKDALRILNAPDLGALFGPNSRAEVAVAANIRPPNGKGPCLRLSGQIDRLADLGEKILVVDFKTNRSPPLNVDDVATAYLFQLAAYRLALREIYPGKQLSAAILWTRSAQLMEVSDSLMDRYETQLWELGLKGS